LSKRHTITGWENAVTYDPATARAVSTLFRELVNGPAAGAAFMLDPGDEGLLRSLDKVSAAEASTTVGGGSSIAARD
jgi:hypothetical protein